MPAEQAHAYSLGCKPQVTNQFALEPAFAGDSLKRKSIARFTGCKLFFR
jgi:hypothetical protein